MKILGIIYPLSLKQKYQISSYAIVPCLEKENVGHIIMSHLFLESTGMLIRVIRDSNVRNRFLVPF